MADNSKEVTQTPPPQQPGSDDNRRRTRSQTRNGGITPPAPIPEVRSRKRASQGQSARGSKRTKGTAVEPVADNEQPPPQPEDQPSQPNKPTEAPTATPTKLDASNKEKEAPKEEEQPQVCQLKKPEPKAPADETKTAVEPPLEVKPPQKEPEQQQQPPKKPEEESTTAPEEPESSNKEQEAQQKEQSPQDSCQLKKPNIDNNADETKPSTELASKEEPQVAQEPEKQKESQEPPQEQQQEPKQADVLAATTTVQDNSCETKEAPKDVCQLKKPEADIQSVTQADVPKNDVTGDEVVGELKKDGEPKEPTNVPAAST